MIKIKQIDGNTLGYGSKGTHYTNAANYSCWYYKKSFFIIGKHLCISEGKSNKIKYIPKKSSTNPILKTGWTYNKILLEK